MKKLIPVTLLVLPGLVLAQNLGGVGTFLNAVRGLLPTATAIVVGLALLAFFYGLVQAIWMGGDNVEKGKGFMIWSIVALFLIASVNGIIGWLGQNLNVNQGGSIQVPGVQGL